MDLPEKGSVDKKLVNKFAKAIKKATKPGIDRRELRDEVAERLEKLVRNKHKKKKDVVVAGPEYASEPTTVDMMAILKNSLARSRRKAS